VTDPATPDLVDVERVPWGDIAVAEDDRTLTVLWTRGVWQRLQGIEVVEGDEVIDVRVLVGTPRELAERAKREGLFFTMQAIMESTEVVLERPVAGRRFGNAEPRRPG
jgi:hypothetical protein